MLAKDNVLASGDLTLLNKFVQYGLILDWNDASQALQARAFSKLDFILANIDPQKLAPLQTKTIDMTTGEESVVNVISPRDKLLCMVVVLPPETSIPILEKILKRSPEPSTVPLNAPISMATEKSSSTLYHSVFATGSPR